MTTSAINADIRRNLKSNTMKKISKVKQYQLEHWAIWMWLDKMGSVATEEERNYMSQRLADLNDKLASIESKRFEIWKNKRA